MRALIWLFGIFFLVLIGALLIFGGGKKAPAPTGPVLKPLPSYATTGSDVSLTIDGQINGDDQHRAIKITVNQNQRVLQIIQGYSGNVIDSHSFSNSQDAYSAFLNALNTTGYLIKIPNSSDNYASRCPLSNRYIMRLDQGSNNLSTLWTTDCGAKTGSFGGDFGTVEALFQDQITNYQELTSQVVL
jgi:hypothetical protein